MAARFEPRFGFVSSDLVGTLVDARYRVERRVGAGGSGTVYAAEHINLGARVALKVLHDSAEAEPGRRTARVERFLGEARILQRLRHPNIVNVLGAGFVGQGAAETPYIALAWCEGITLAEILAASRGGLPRSPAEAWRLVGPIVEAVAYAHAQGVVHCDLTPSNVMVEDIDGAQHPRVIDFGIAQLGREGAPVEDRGDGGRRAFTRDYAAPEQISGGITGPATDVHAIGLILLEVLANRPPYGEGDAGLAAIDPVRPSARRRGLPPGPFDAALDRALALDPNRRFADAGELATALREASRWTGDVSTGGGLAFDATKMAPPPPTRTRRRAWLLGAAAAVVLLAGGGTAAVALRSKPTIASLDIAEIRKRMLAKGYTVLHHSRGAIDSITIRDGQETVQIWIDRSRPCDGAKDCRVAVRDMMIRLANTTSTTAPSFAYASDGEATLVVMTFTSARSEWFRELVLEGRPATTRGVVSKGDLPSGAGRSAARLADMGPDELATHLQKAGFTVTWTGKGQSGIVCMGAYGAGADVGSATLYDGDVPAIIRSIDGQRESYAWAQAGSRALVLRGPGKTATEASLLKVIAATDAKLGGSRK